MERTAVESVSVASLRNTTERQKLRNIYHLLPPSKSYASTYSTFPHLCRALVVSSRPSPVSLIDGAVMSRHVISCLSATPCFLLNSRLALGQRYPSLAPQRAVHRLSSQPARALDHPYMLSHRCDTHTDFARVNFFRRAIHVPNLITHVPSPSN